MSRREILTRAGLGAAALLCLALSVVFVLLAADVVRWREAMDAGDVRYGASTEETRLWQAESAACRSIRRGACSGSTTTSTSARRFAHFASRGSRIPSSPIPSSPSGATTAQARLEALVATAPDDATRSRAASLLGALGLARFVYETQEREALLSGTVSNLTLAIDLDPTNDEPKYNLELAYQRGRGIQLSEAAAGTNPSPGGQGSKGAGAGEPGSGY